MDLATIDLREAAKPAREPAAGIVPRCRPLLTAYQQVLDGSQVPCIVFQRRRAGSRHLHPRISFRPAVRFFVKRHIARSLRSLTCAYQRRAALLDGDGIGTDEALKQFDVELGLIARYEQSLGWIPPFKVLAAGFILAAFLASFVLVSELPYPQKEETLSFLQATSAHLLPPDLPELWRAATHAASGGEEAAAGASPRFSKGLGRDDWEVMSLAVLAMMAALSIMLRLLPIGSFSLKRLAFNLYPDQVPRRPDGTRFEHKRSMFGLYELEDRLFRELDARPPQEVPLDLIRSVVMVIPLVLAGLASVGVMVAIPIVEGPSALGALASFYLPVAVVFLPLCVIPGLRLHHIVAIWRHRRNREAGDPWVRSWAGPRVPKRNAAAMGALVLSGVVLGFVFADEQADPARWGTLAVANLALGIVTTWLGRLASFRTNPARSLRPTCRAIGYLIGVVGLSGMLALHHPGLFFMTLVITIGVVITVESLPVPSRWTSTLRRALCLSVVPLLPLSLVVVALWAWLEPIGPYPTPREHELLNHVPSGIGCRRPPTEPLYPEAIELECRTSRAWVTLHQFGTPGKSTSAFDSYIRSKSLPSRSCDPAANPDFSGSAPWSSGGKQVGRVACYVDRDGDPWIEWTRPDHEIYAYATPRDVPGDPRQALFEAWQLLNPPV